MVNFVIEVKGNRGGGGVVVLVSDEKGWNEEDEIRMGNLLLVYSIISLYGLLLHITLPFLRQNDSEQVENSVHFSITNNFHASLFVVFFFFS